ncbi:amidase [Halalkalicoccus paucihalophilus]|uniref:Amidase n=1 Tax=Halalkalicoccus paucihalophilus TaxID=1008153 RepID=A0A151AEA1_9EURY|nr:amidase [Halalkalicoccus paucihalophilus]KYH25910.1 amidase [Halalkalicoccus paucihalophilus]
MTDLRPPTTDEIERYAATHHMDLSEREVEDLSAAIPAVLGAYERLDELSASEPDVEYPDRTAGEAPSTEEDPLNAFVRTCLVEGAESGPLAGYDVGLKDNVSVAGIETTFGSDVVSGFVPSIDATVVTRLLAAGASITGKLNMEDLAFSGSGEMSAHGPVKNPYDPDHLAGGSSSGSAAAVVTGDVDVAIGGDQGGSIRIPAAWSGCVGHKPTYGLVPYTGILGLGRSFDHTGPLARSVADCARVLEVIAGDDPLDPRQGAVTTQPYTELLDESTPEALTVGVLEEGFGHDESDPDVDETVRDALDTLAETGTAIEDVSIPMHLDGLAIWNGVANEETTATIAGEGIGHFGNGYYDTDLMAAFAEARRENADAFPPTIKLVATLGEYLTEEYHGRYYAKARNLSMDLAAAYDEVLEDVDVLAMPTTPQTAHERLEDPSDLQIIERAVNMLPNTAPFDVTGHPALSIPVGTTDGLPVGLMLAGRRFDDATVLQAGHAVERSVE